MGMLYYQCKHCEGTAGIQAQFIGNVVCERCNILLFDKCKGVPKFEHFDFHCTKCNFTISFEAVNCTNVSCTNCNKIMKKLIEVKKKNAKTK